MLFAPLPVDTPTIRKIPDGHERPSGIFICPARRNFCDAPISWADGKDSAMISCGEFLEVTLRMHHSVSISAPYTARQQRAYGMVWNTKGISTVTTDSATQPVRLIRRVKASAGRR